VDIPLYTLVIAGVVLVAVVFALLSVVFYLLRKVRVLSRVRYGFGGKPLFSILVLAGITLSIPFTLFASRQTIDYVNYASAEKDVVLELSEKLQSDGNFEVTFMAFPTVDKEVWADHKYDIQWKVEGNQISFEKIEENRSKQNRSFFVKVLPPGEYLVSVNVVSSNFNVTKEVQLVLMP